MSLVYKKPTNECPTDLSKPCECKLPDHLTGPRHVDCGVCGSRAHFGRMGAEVDDITGEHIQYICGKDCERENEARKVFK